MQIVIVGAGTVGFDLAVQLQRAGHDVGLVEKHTDRCAEIRDKLDILVVEGPGSSPRALIDAGLREAQMVLAVTSVDEVNILVCGLAAQFGVKTRIARVRNPEFTGSRARVNLTGLGVTRVIDPERIIVRVIHNIARIPDVVEVFSYHDDEILIARHVMKPEMPIIGKSLVQILQEAGSDRFLSVALRRDGEARIPAGDDVIRPGDDVTTLFRAATLPRYLEFLGLSGRKVRKAIVAGESLTAVRLCAALEEWVEDVLLIDPDAAHGQTAAERLDGVEVIHGDATDRAVLAENNVGAADLFVGAGRITADNVMGALLARSVGAGRVVAVSDEPSNNRLFRELGVDHVVSPRRLMAQEIMDVIHRGRRSMELHLRDMPLESLLIRADPGSRVTRGPLLKVWRPLRSRAIVGAVVHEGKTIIPRGDTHIAAGDDAIVITEERQVGKIQKLFGGKR
ncbi:MAG: Trk system potassium transporter TrkA [Candidatus Eisenbacteria sp.]|nr:Trk system potassium transporter TrkA [Candidatus Eisenbacteria bacterium]